MPSFTRSGRPRASFASSPPAGMISATPLRRSSRSAAIARMLPVAFQWAAHLTPSQDRHIDSATTSVDLPGTHGPGGTLAPMVKARCLALFVVLAFLAGACDLPRLDDQRERPLAQTSSVYASDGSLITDLHATENRVILTPDQ